MILEQHFWHTYRTHWCITDSLSVSLEAPKTLDCFCDVFPHRDARIEGARIDDNRYRSQVTLQGLVFADSTIRWIFHQK